jgi:hypothetical protein
VMGRPRSVTALGVVLILIALLALLNVARGLVGYFESAGYGGIATRVSVAEFVVTASDQILVPAAIGIGSALASTGVFRGRRWGQVLAICVGSAILLVGAMLTLPTIVEWGVPGSFALLLLPGALIAFLVGGYVLYAAFVNRAYFSQ